jgi:protease-4
MQEKSRGIIGRLFSGLWRLVTWIRVSLANLVFLLAIIFLVVIFSMERLPTVPERAALIISPSGQVVEKLSLADPLHLFGGDSGRERETLLKDLIDAIDRARDDGRIELILLRLDALEGAGITKTRDIAEALRAFRAAGKKVIAVGDNYSQGQYLLAAEADEIWMHPYGLVEFAGFGIYRNYYAEALEKLGIDVHVFRAGTFKSAYEFLDRDSMSEADRSATAELLGEIWASYTGSVTERRGLPPGAVDHFANGIDEILGARGGDAARAALDYGFVDALKTHGEMEEALKERVGESEDGGFNAIDFRDYLRAVRPAFDMPKEGVRSVGVIVASGMILDGEHQPGSIGADSLAELIRDAAEDGDIKALVLRIDSPGGSGFGSEIIREALQDFKARGKPLVASMGSTAASGGYWIASPADEIWASPTTLTGSIGVLSAFPTVSRGLAELGIHNDGVGTTEVAGGLDVSRPLSPVMERVLRLQTQNFYQRFIDVVAEGRKMDPERVARLAEGRVWTGRQAAANGLVDNLGDIEDAVKAAARLADLEKYELRYLEEPLSWRNRLLRSLSLAESAWLRDRLGRVYGAQALLHPNALLSLLEPARGPYALCGACPAL